MMRLPNCIVQWLHRKCERIMQSRQPDFVIGRLNHQYMQRWYLLRTPIGGLYLHRFLDDDDDQALHDHPFRSLSFVVDGRMREIYAQAGWNPIDKAQHSVRMIKSGDIVCRSAKFTHRIELLSPQAVTLFFIGPHEREWGFWCPKGWRIWKEYCDPVDTGRVGRGCD